jgi:hypothetical protein
MNEIQMLKIMERYVCKGDTEFGGIKVTRVPDYKTVFVEQNGSMGRAIILTRYKVEGKTYWAGYSSRSETVYVSLAA